jgi:hypothetical protein
MKIDTNHKTVTCFHLSITHHTNKLECFPLVQCLQGRTELALVEQHINLRLSYCSNPQTLNFDIGIFFSKKKHLLIFYNFFRS